MNTAQVHGCSHFRQPPVAIPQPRVGDPLLLAVVLPPGDARHGLPEGHLHRLTACALRAALRRARLRLDQVDELVYACPPAQGGCSHAALELSRLLRLPATVPVSVVGSRSGNGLRALQLAAQSIRSGEARCVLIAAVGGAADDTAALVLVAADHPAARCVPPLAAIVASAGSGADPAAGTALPTAVTRSCLERAGWERAEVTCAVQADDEDSAVGTRAYAGQATGARILLSLLDEMACRAATRGLVTLCTGSGQGVAIAIQRRTTHP
ncbi:MAG TPA: hypothetical protein VIX81_05090 [Gammaproteobacteria bacterium]